jgi:pimeloyl-ACP methyl ester carboxylesterase
MQIPIFAQQTARRPDHPHYIKAFDQINMEYELREEGKFRYLETQGGEENLLLLHGLFGALSNFGSILDHFGARYNVIVPLLPIFELPLRKVTLSGLRDHVADFVAHKGYEQVHVLGNSLGGHVSILYTLAHQDRVASLTLTGSSGLFENTMGNTFPKRGDFDYIKKKTEATFYDPTVATDELVEEVYGIVNDRNRAIRIIATAKSAIRNNVADRLAEIRVPALLVWGQQDTVTPAFVGEKFDELLPDSRLHLVDKCGHAPMMERPEEFNRILEAFLVEVHQRQEVG